MVEEADEELELKSISLRLTLWALVGETEESDDDEDDAISDSWSDESAHY